MLTCCVCGAVYEPLDVLNCYYCGSTVCTNCYDVDANGNETCPGCYVDILDGEEDG